MTVSSYRTRLGADRRRARASPIARGLGALSVVLAAAAVANYALARRAEHRDPPRGSFVRVDGVRLHYIERGKGPVIVLLHGNGTMARDFELSGIMDMLAKEHRVIAFDRPGFGYTERPRGRIWTAEAQADLLRDALLSLRVPRAIVVGHSWGTLVALAMAARHPSLTTGLVLLAGYYYPTARIDVVLTVWPAVPILGDVLRYTISPLLGRLIAPAAYRKMFAPAPVPAQFGEHFPLGLAVRPGQIRAAAEDAALMIPAAATMAAQYRDLSLPVAVVAGPEDNIVDFDHQPRRLSEDLPHSTLRQIEGVGHMLHHIAPQKITAVIEEFARSASARTGER